MSDNSNLHTANKSKKDEFYTQLSDIENELRHYKEHFRGKTVFCNCDDPRISNFFKYFALNFEHLGLKRLITTCYKSQDIDLFSLEQSEKAVYLIYDGDRNGNRQVDLDEIEVQELKGDGDFRSPECIELLRQADIVVTNPPFSLFREYLAQLIKYDKKFLIIGNQNAITYKEVFPLIAANRIWLGYHSGHTLFAVPDDYTIPDFYDLSDTKKLKSNGYHIDANGKLWRNLGNICWFTNLDIDKRHEPIILFRNYTPEAYPKYDNYDAINVDRVADIPVDYNGVMGVPITFLDKYCPEQFEIVAFRKGTDGKDLVYSLSRNTPPSSTRCHSTSYTILPNTHSENYDTRHLTEIGHTSTENECMRVFSSATSIPGMIKNAEGKINGKITYARLLIRRI